MTEVLSTGAEDFAFLGELVLKSARSVADKPIRMLVFAPAASGETLEEARERVQRTDVAERRALAQRFAEHVRGAPDVTEVWLQETWPSLVTALVVTEVTLDRELELRAQFAELTYKYDAELRMYTESEGHADYAREGERLHG